MPYELMTERHMKTIPPLPPLPPQIIFFLLLSSFTTLVVCESSVCRCLLNLVCVLWTLFFFLLLFGGKGLGWDESGVYSSVVWVVGVGGMWAQLV